MQVQSFVHAGNIPIWWASFSLWDRFQIRWGLLTRNKFILFLRVGGDFTLPKHEFVKSLFSQRSDYIALYVVGKKNPRSGSNGCRIYLWSLFVVISVTVCCCSGLCGSSFSSHSWSLLVGLGGLEPSQHSFFDEKSRQFPLSFVLNRVFSPTLLGTFSVFFPTHLGTLLACFYFLAI